MSKDKQTSDNQQNGNDFIADVSSRFYRDDSFVEHGCCWDAAIVTKCEKGKGMYCGDIDLICECDSENVDMILTALNGC